MLRPLTTLAKPVSVATARRLWRAPGLTALCAPGDLGVHRPSDAPAGRLRDRPGPALPAAAT